MKKDKNHIKREDIKRYLENEMSSAERHQLEKASLEDGFAFEALEGLEDMDQEDFMADMAELDQRIDEKTRVKRGFSYLKIAAAVLLLGMVGSVAYLLMNDFQKQVSPLAQETLQDEASIPDSVDNTVSSLPDSPEDSTTSTRQPLSFLNNDEENRETSEPEEKTVVRQQETSPASGAKALPEVRGIDEISDLDVTENEIVLAEAEYQESKELIGTLKDEELKKQSKSRLSAEESQKLNQIETTDRAAAQPTASYSYLPEQSRTIAGTVIDATSKSGIRDVTISIPSEDLQVTTNEEGRFRIMAPTGTSRMVARKEGYGDHEFDAESHNHFEITLNREDDLMTEVYITEYGLRSIEELEIESQKNSEPEIGLQAYNRYLKDSVRIPEEAVENNISGRVIVQFEVLPTGKLNNISIIKSLGHGCDEEAIRLIREGSQWIPAMVNDIVVTQEVKVVVRFR